MKQYLSFLIYDLIYIYLINTNISPLFSLIYFIYYFINKNSDKIIDINKLEEKFLQHL